jgi:hypothetical protein
MSNLEENQQSDNNSPVEKQSGSQENSSGQSDKPEGSSEETKAAGSGSKDQKGVDSARNSNHEHMRIDEEGSEIGPDDEV